MVKTGVYTIWLWYLHPPHPPKKNNQKKEAREGGRKERKERKVREWVGKKSCILIKIIPRGHGNKAGQKW